MNYIPEAWENLNMWECVLYVFNDEAKQNYSR